MSQNPGQKNPEQGLGQNTGQNTGQSQGQGQGQSQGQGQPQGQGQGQSQGQRKSSFQATSGFTRKATNQEAKNYNFVAARGNIKTTNFIGSIGLTLKACLGGGVVAIHESYKQCGMWTSMVLNVLLGVAVGYCMYQLAHSAQIMYGRVQVPTMTYPDLAEASLALGPWEKLKKYSKSFRYSVDVIVIIDLFGSCCVYQVVVARTIKQLFDETTTVDESVPPSIRVYIAVLTIPIMALCMIKSLAYLAPFSIVADIFIVIVAGATVYYGVKANTIPASELPAFKTIPGLLEFIGVCVFGMEGVGAVLAVENHMANPKQMGMVITLGMTIVITLMSIVGFFGYWGFGEDASSPVTVNYPFTIFSTILKVSMAFMIYVTYGLSFWVPFELCWHYLKRRYDESKYWLWERVYRGFFVIVITIIAAILPNVSNFLGLIGSFCLSMMGFVFPAFIELAIIWEEPGLGAMKWRLIKATVIIIFGFVMCILGTYSNCKDLIKNVFMKKVI